MKNEAYNILIKDYDYNLSHERIAEFPLQERDKSKLLVYENGEIADDYFFNLPENLPHDSTLVLNNTRVIEARVLFKKTTGGVIEIFCLEPFKQTIEQSLSSIGRTQWQCLIGGASKWKHGQVLQKEIVINNETVSLKVNYIDKEADSFIIEFSWQTQHSFAEVLHAAGAIPLPPYIKRNATEEDKERYQTVFAKEEGSVAAPTAALHFTKSVFENLKKKNVDAQYITLHVGAGTFKPVKTETVAEHEMHREPFTVSIDVLKKFLSSKKIIVVGTTSLRTLESIYWLGVKLINGLIQDEWTLQQWEAYDLRKNYSSASVEESLVALINWLEQNHQTELHCQTSLIIVPGYEFKIPEGLITNFHQPQSTLLLLVSAFIGEDWKKIYQHALDNDYRFLSYGDSSLLWRKN
ncbi:MAG TPA: S-adenosylmethionine:tRNA ribosyltransferase-isomerase [Flavisolibacter sp.]|jgi:S-adenosylmethionine:tRNA ribosyltransferase-isomerase|nr:S-adenosylmethionine:tRNA ribosyltransferase-isomerase [Flavisolibacter sp.]